MVDQYKFEIVFENRFVLFTYLFIYLLHFKIKSDRK